MRWPWVTRWRDEAVGLRQELGEAQGRIAELRQNLDTARRSAREAEEALLAWKHRLYHADERAALAEEGLRVMRVRMEQAEHRSRGAEAHAIAVDALSAAGRKAPAKKKGKAVTKRRRKA